MQLEIFKAMLTFLLELFPRLYRFRSKRTEDKFQNVVNIYDEMFLLSSMTDIHRVLLLKIEDSGGLIDPKVQLYASVLYEDYRAPVRPAKGRYAKLPVDQVYVRMLHKVIQEQKHRTPTAQMDDGILKSIYISEGINNTEMYYLGSTSTALYVMSVSSVTSDTIFSEPEYIVKSTMVVENIKKHLWNARPN